MLYSPGKPCGQLCGGGSVNVLSAASMRPRRFRVPSLLLSQVTSMSETFFHARRG